MYTVSLTKLEKKMNLTNLTPEIDLDNVLISQMEIDRPSLQLAGFYDHFNPNRIQVIGNVEYAYIEYLEKNGKDYDAFSALFSRKITCLILCRSKVLKDDILKLAVKYQIPILQSQEQTSPFVAEMIRWLHVELAQRVAMHATLIDVFGEGVLLIGESGIGKSESALELVKRGHRLVSDDLVEIRRVSAKTLIGTSPELTRYLLELRGVGIIDVKTLFGVESVKETKEIDVAIVLEEWNRANDQRNLGIENEVMDILGIDIKKHSIPVKPGRNIAILVETTAINHRQLKMGYNAAAELFKRI